MAKSLDKSETYEMFIEVRFGDKHCQELDRIGTGFKINLKQFVSTRHLISHFLREYAEEIDRGKVKI